MLKHIPFYASLLEQTLLTGNKPSSSHILVYGAVEAHSMGDRGCIASNKTIATEVGLSEGRTANIISELAMSDWVKVHMDENNHRILIEPMMTLHVGVNPPSRQREPPLHGSVNIEYSKENTVIDNTTDKKMVIKKSDPNLEEMTAYWVEAIGRKPRSGGDLTYQKKLLKEEGLDRVKGAIQVVKMGLTDQYAPQITSFKDLWYKWDKLELYARKKVSTQQQRSVTITE